VFFERPPKKRVNFFGFFFGTLQKKGDQKHEKLELEIIWFWPFSETRFCQKVVPK